MKINIQTISHKNQRYETSGDWWFDENQDLQIRVSDMGNWKYEALVACHELLEALLCKAGNKSEQDITNFDIEYEKNRKQGDNIEPGDSHFAPYRAEHFFATSIERLMAQELGVDWEEYDKGIMCLD